MDDHTKIIKDSVEELLKLMSLETEIEVVLDEDNYNVQIDLPETGVLIGYHGQTLAAIQMILGQIVCKKIGEWVKINVNISDYWENRQEQLKNIADMGVEEVEQEKKSYTLPYLNSKERRFVHMYLKEKKDIKTESVGEREQRRLVIFPSSGEQV
jgi:spoIIIJ-associated protein